MKNNPLLIAAGIGLAAVLAASIISYSPDRGALDHSAMTMHQMATGLDGLQGDTFDKAFIEMMIVHHEGAIEMAERIPANAKHVALKQLGRKITAAQSREITLMKRWLKDWGYEGTGETERKMMDETMPEMKH